MRCLAGPAEEHTVRRVQVGLVYSGVELDSGAVGVAYTFPASRGCGGALRGDGKPLGGRRASELLRAPAGEDLVASTVALATVNALLACRPLPHRARSGDILDRLQIREGDRVCMVGCFLPLLEVLKVRKIPVTAVDEVPRPGCLPPEAVRWLLPNSQVAIITATSIINDTIDSLLELAASCREVAILGPSTPLVPEAFADTPVTCLGGIRVQEGAEVLRTISEGRGFRDFKRYVRKVNLRVAPPIRASIEPIDVIAT